eukprot:Rhum_TRINITY_DN20769_c0_g1::Rhum_TRINITY_DN20769_c0_g1_i1::g.172175::m.172175
MNTAPRVSSVRGQAKRFVATKHRAFHPGQLGCSRKRGLDHVIVGVVGHSDVELRVRLHRPLGRKLGTRVASPGAAGDAVVDVPVQHRLQVPLGLVGAVQHHAEAAVHHLSPPDAAAVVQRHPRRATEGVADEVLHGHVRAEHGPVADVRRLAVGRVRARDVVVVAAQDHGRRDAAVLHRLVEGARQPPAAHIVRVQDARLAAHDELVLGGALDPLDVVRHLLLDLGRRLLHLLRQHLGGELVRHHQVGRVARRAHPAVRPKAVVEAHRAHDVLDVRGVDEAGAVLLHDVRARTRRLQEEGVAVVPEVHALLAQAVDVVRVHAQRLLHLRLELLGLLRHHHLRLLERRAVRVVAAGPWVVQRRLVRAQVHLHAALVHALEHLDDVADVAHGNRLALGRRRLHEVDGLVDVLRQVCAPPLLEALLRRHRVHLRHDRGHTCDHARLRLRAAHAAETAGDELHAGARVAVEVLPRGVHDGDGRAVHDALRADVHERARRHLAVLRHAEGVHALVVVLRRVVRDHHAVRDHEARCVHVRREHAVRVAGVHHQRLVRLHLAQVLHRETVLRPVLERRAVAAVRDQLLGELRHGGVEVVVDHRQQRFDLAVLRGVVLRVVRAEVVLCRLKAHHVDAAVRAQLLRELGRQLAVPLLGEVAQRVAQGQLLLARVQDLLARGHVVHVGVGLVRGRQHLRDALAQVLAHRARGAVPDLGSHPQHNRLWLVLVSCLSSNEVQIL